jgi:heat shock protein 1/8
VHRLSLTDCRCLPLVPFPQTEIDVCVYEGERSRTDQNNLLGKFSISGIEKAKRGVPKIDVSFALDSNGMLAVTAKDQTTGAEAHIQIQRSGRSSEAEVERMVRRHAHARTQRGTTRGKMSDRQPC